MELKATSLLLLMCVGIIILTSNEAGAIPRCCLTVSKKIPREVLRAVTIYETQSKSGSCEIDALILHTRNRKKLFCAHPRLGKVLKKLKKKPKRA
ncbi:hypothetical protein DPX16_2450 [Anabarilius grahami]|uniref:Chemokine interleukin-8-like domain-containing protein n=1 Tax=Anabarilius grahami TaxID=495550 RepID=A0A3N0Z5H4_ANAGA|nr:hypothetical protein DPX16_2450 [Anabarilius grahami]